MSNIVLNKAFKECNESKARYKVVMGGAGSGKSVNTAMDFIAKLSNPFNIGANLLVVRSCEQSHRQSTFSELRKAVEIMGLSEIWDIREYNMTFRNIYTGSEILFRGCSDERARERLKSVTSATGKLCWVWIEEATELRQSDVEIIDDRLRGELPDNLYYQITMTFNPVSATHWIKKVYWDSTDKNIFKCHTTYLDNKFIDEQYSERMERRKETDPQGYKIYALGEWGVTDGLIFTNWTAGTYKAKDFDNLSIGTDFGFNHNHATLLLGEKDGDVYVLQEFVTNKKTKSEIIKRLNLLKIPKNVPMYCDSAEPASIREFRQAGYKALPVVKEPNSVKAQISWLKDRHIYVDGRCIQTMKELQQYRYIQDRVSGEYTDDPITVNDDCIAGLRYGIEPWRKNKALRTMRKGDLGL